MVWQITIGCSIASPLRARLEGLGRYTGEHCELSDRGLQVAGPQLRRRAQFPWPTSSPAKGHSHPSNNQSTRTTRATAATRLKRRACSERESQLDIDDPAKPHKPTHG